jgi:hypothetical protein
MHQILTRNLRRKSTVTAVVIFLTAIGLWARPARVDGQECYPPEVIEAVGRLAKLRTAQVSWRVAARPRLEEELIGLEQASHGENSEPRAIKFYEVSPAIYHVVKGKIVGVTVQLDDDSAWVVGVGPEKALYRLAGFPDSVSDFNRLMRDSTIRVSGPETALEVFDVFLKVAHSHDFSSSVVGDVMQLQSIALQDFRLRLPESTRLAAYDRWWKAMPPKIRARIASPKVRSSESSFEVLYYRYAEGVLKEESVLISPEGAVTPNASSRTLYGS